MSDVLPIGVPTRGELWRRVRLAESLLAHRQPCPETTRLVLAVLHGSDRPYEQQPNITDSPARRGC